MDSIIKSHLLLLILGIWPHMKVKYQRWKTAQNYEKNWWESHISSIQPDFYFAYAEELLRDLNGIFTIKEDTPILEIGSGAAGIITHLESRFRHAIDPLEDFYSTIHKFQEFRDKDVKYHTGQAEKLPFSKDKFELIIIDNVLDHCADIDSIFQEASRVLKSNGIIYLRLNIYTNWGKFVRKIVEILQIDPGHPHTFSWKSLLNQIKKFDFKIVKVKRRGFWLTWISELKSMKAKELSKAFSFSSPNKTLIIFIKQS